MNYYLDTEFLCTNHAGIDETVELISIALLREDGKSFYRISKSVDVKDVYLNDWIRENVIPGLMPKQTVSRFEDFKRMMANYGKPREQIRNDLTDFIREEEQITKCKLDARFFAYYSAYDWVLFCQLFGGLMNLPKGFAYHCVDLRVLFDVAGMTKEQPKRAVPQSANKHNAEVDCRWNLDVHRYLAERVPMLSLGLTPEKPTGVVQRARNKELSHGNEGKVM